MKWSLTVLSIIVFGVAILAAAGSPTPVVVQPISVEDARSAGVGGTGCWWRPSGDAQWRFAMSGHTAVVRVVNKLIVLRPVADARNLFPFTFDRWKEGNTTVRVVPGKSVRRSRTESLDMPARLLVTIGGVSARYAGTMRCGS